MRFIEVKGRAAGSDTVFVTQNEMRVGFNQPDKFILAIVEVDGTERRLHYVPNPLEREPQFEEVGVTFSIGKLLERAERFEC